MFHPGHGLVKAKFLLAGTLALFLAVAVAAQPPPGASVPTVASQPVAQPSPLDQPLQLIVLARQSYQNVRDYSCLFIKREQIRGQLQPENMIEMKVRKEPFSVYLRWLSPQNLAGQEACYVTGRYNGMMRVHSVGLAGVAGFVSIDPNDPRVAQNSRHPITEAGIGNLIERFGQRWQLERQVNKTQVRIAEFQYNQRLCTRVETIHPEYQAGVFYSYRSVVYFDKETHLPIRTEAYDWPRQGGPSDGSLFECYSYAHLRLNIGLRDGAFQY
jgi:hypothetical protein